MDERTIQAWRERLEAERQRLRDPIPAVWQRVDSHPKTAFWFGGAGLAAAVLVAVLGFGTLAAPNDGGWGPIVDDLWARPSTAEFIPDATFETESETWNIWDLADDQGV